MVQAEAEAAGCESEFGLVVGIDEPESRLMIERPVVAHSFSKRSAVMAERLMLSKSWMV